MNLKEITNHCIHFERVVDDFYAITSIPTGVYDAYGKCLYSQGISPVYRSLYQHLNSYEKIVQHLETYQNNGYFTLEAHGIYFTGLFICPFEPTHGLYILGPYRTDKKGKDHIPYKPEHLLSNIIDLLRQLACPTPHHSAPVDTSHSYHVKRIFDYIHKNFHQDISLNHVADALNLSIQHLAAQLKKDTGKTFTHVLNEIRIQNALLLFNEKEKSLLDIALTVGYKSQSHFSMAFRKIHGLTPLQYRKEHYFSNASG